MVFGLHKLQSPQSLALGWLFCVGRDPPWLTSPDGEALFIHNPAPVLTVTLVWYPQHASIPDCFFNPHPRMFSDFRVRGKGKGRRQGGREGGTEEGREERGRREGGERERERERERST